MRGGAPSDSSHNHTPIPSTFPEEEEEWNTVKTPKSGRVTKPREKEHCFAPMPTNPTDPLDNPFTGSSQLQPNKGGCISAMSMSFLRRGDINISNVADHVQALSSEMFN